MTEISRDGITAGEEIGTGCIFIQSLVPPENGTARMCIQNASAVVNGTAAPN